MSYIDSNQPVGTPTWIDLTVPDLERAADFYRALFGWDYSTGSAGDGPGITALLYGRPVAGLTPGAGSGTDSGSEPGPGPDSGAGPASGRGSGGGWCVYFATDDCDGTAQRVTGAGGTVIRGPLDVGDQCRTARATDPSGVLFGLWQGRSHPGCQVVNEPGSLLRNDLVTPAPGPVRDFYPAVFGFTLDGNEDLPGLDFTFLRRPDGHEIGGIIGDKEVPLPAWRTLFAVTDADAAVERGLAAGGTAEPPFDMSYGRMAEITDPFGNTFSVGAPLRGQQR